MHIKKLTKLLQLKAKSSSGFTLLEVLLSVALIALIAGFSVPLYQSFQVRNDLDIATVTATQTFRRAQALSQAVDGDISWGLKIQSGSLTLFKGTSFTARDTSFDEVFDVPGTIVASGLTEVVFAKFSGLPQSTGTITLTSTSNEARTITVNSKGTISY